MEANVNVDNSQMDIFKNMDLFKFSYLSKTLSGSDIKYTSSDASRINYVQLEGSSISGINNFK